MDRLVTLFLQAMKPEVDALDATAPTRRPSPEDIDRGAETVEKLLTGEEAQRMSGGSPAATLVLLAMALEEKPFLEDASIRFYERALHFISGGTDESGWERCTVLQQVSKVCLQTGRLKDAERHLSDCWEACEEAHGHPKDAGLFGGGFSTQQTRSEFMSTVAKMRCKICMDQGQDLPARALWAEVQRLDSVGTSDAVERQSASRSAAPKSVPQGAEGPKALWAAAPAEERRLQEYRYTDEGSTVLLILDLNEHLGIGNDASELVDSLQQFKVVCEKHLVEVSLRLRRRDGRLCHFSLRLEPLVNEIVPEDTVPKLRGKEGKRRLEVKLFKREKNTTWYGDFVSERKPKASTKRPEPQASGRCISLTNPLTPEEIAALPTPGGGATDNRPSAVKSAFLGAAVPASAVKPKVVVPTPPSSKRSEAAPEPAEISPAPAPSAEDDAVAGGWDSMD